MDKTEVLHDLLYTFAHRFLPNMTLKGSPDMADLLSDSYRLKTNEPFKKVFQEVIDKKKEVDIRDEEFKVKEFFKESIPDIYIINFPKPTYPTGAIYVGVVDSDYMQYFVLELADEGRYMVGSYYLNKDDKVTRRFWGYKGKSTMEEFYEFILTKLDDHTALVQKEHEKFLDKPVVKSMWKEWQLYILLILYFFLHSYLRYLIYGQFTTPGILHLALVTLIYELYWHKDKSFTLKKLLMSLLWLVVGNIGLGIFAFVVGIILGVITTVL